MSARSKRPTRPPSRRKPAPRPSDRVAVGRIIGPWGVRGEMKIEPLTDFPRRFEPGSYLWIGDRNVRVGGARAHKGRILLSVTGIDDPDAADALRGMLLEVMEADLPDLPPDTYYRYQLIGLDVRTTEGVSLGTVVDVLETGANEVLVVRERPADRTSEVLIPAIGDVILEIDVAQRTILIEPIEGLLPELKQARTRSAERSRRRPA